jgi:hypothetical protein
MDLTLNAAVLLAALYLAGIIEFAIWCHLAPVAPKIETSED